MQIIIFALILFFPAAVFADGTVDSTNHDERESAGVIDQGSSMNNQSESSISTTIEVGELQAVNTPEPLSTDTDISAGDPIQGQVNESDLKSLNFDLDEQVSSTEDSITVADGNSYKAEINVGAPANPDPTGPPHTTPNQNIAIKVTFSELGNSTPLGSARIFLDVGFSYTDYDDSGSTGLTVTSSYGDDVASRWSAVWQDITPGPSVLLTANDASGYLGENGWVSVLFNAQAPAVEGEYTFETEAWTDRDQTTINNMHPDYQDPTIVVSDQVSYRIIENILTDVELKQILADDSRVDVPDPMPHPDQDLLDLEISYRFNLPVGHQYIDGAFFEFALPAEFAVYNEVTGSLIDGDSNIFGQYRLSTDRTVRLTFNDRITTYVASGLDGWVNFQTEVREDLDGDLQREIVINIRDNTLVRIPFNFSPNAGSSIDKRGIPNQTYNADSITWMVDFNKDLQTIENAVLSDPLGVNLTLLDGSIELYFLRVQLDGSVIQEATVPVDQYDIVTSADESVDEGFEIRFNSEINDAYRLVFRTGIDQDGFSYTNTATLTGSNIQPLVAAATVSVDRGAVLEKDAAAYDPDLQSVDWEIRINYNLKEIEATDSTVTDTYGTAQSLLGGSLVVSRVNLDGNGVEIPGTAVEQLVGTDYTFDPIYADPDDPGSTVVGFTITFNNTISSAYRINYQTVPVNRVYGTVTLNNTAQFSGESDGASQTLRQSILTKTHQDVNYANETVQWTILINRDQQPMSNLVITDTFTNSGLTITPGDPNNPADLRSAVAVSGLPVGVTYDIALLSVAEGKGFIINNFRDGLGNPVIISETITITYTTVFAYEELTNPANNFRNNVRLDWVDADSVARDINVTRIFVPNQQTRQNGFKGGSYNAITKEITWTVGVNYNLRDVNNAQVFDYILGNQTLVPGSIAVYSATINANGTVTRGVVALAMGNDPGQYQMESVTGPGSEPNPGFRITFSDNPINSLYIIEYRTSLEDRVIAGQYDNTAYLFSGDDSQAVLNATVSNRNWGIYASKQGSNEGRTVTWQIDINPGLSQLNNVVIEDSLSPGQRILQDTFKVYSTTVTGANGSYERDAELVRDTDYTVAFSGSFNDDERMVLSLIGGYSTINSAYIVEYQTFIEFIYQGQVSNSAVLTATTLGLPDDTGDSEDIGGRITSGQGGIRGFLGRLVVLKTDVSTGTLLPGAQFELRHESGSTVIATATAGSNGTAVFNNVLFGNYNVTEITPPPGYALDDPAPRPVTLSSSSATVTFSNTRFPDDDGDGDDGGGGGTPGGGNPGSGTSDSSGGGNSWDVLSDYYMALTAGKTSGSEAYLSGNKIELPRTGGAGVYHAALIVVVLISAALLYFRRALMVSDIV